jgi:hypothetical protein
MSKISEVMSAAAGRDMMRNPVTLFTLASLSQKGAGDVTDFLLLDISREMQGEPGPAYFPEVRAAVRDYISGAHRAAQVAGMGQSPLALAAASATTATTSGVTAATSTGFDWGKLASDVIGGLVTVGTTIYTNRETAKLQKDEFERREALAAQQAAASAAEAEAALRRQQAAAAELAARQAAGEVPGAGLPGWVTPVAIGAAVLIGGIFILPKILPR